MTRPQSNRLLLVVSVVASALAFALYARATWPWLILGWVGLVPWLVALDRSTSWRGALAAGVLMCVAFVLAVFGWLVPAIQNYTGAPRGVAFIILLLTAPLLQPQLITFTLARHLARGAPVNGDAPLWRIALAGACVYVATEWAWPKLFADTLGHGLYPSFLMRQAADLAGAPGLTFVLLVSNACVAAMARPLWYRKPGWVRAALAPAATVMALAALLLTYGALRYRQLSTAASGSRTVTAALVQANISQYARLAAELGTFDAVRTILDAHFTLSNEARRGGAVDLLVWPETVYPTTFGTPKSPEGAAFDRDIAGFVERIGIPLVLGTYDTDGEHEFNAAAFLQPGTDGHLAFDMYRKAEPFPLTERVPALLESDWVRRWLPWLGTWQAGTGGRVLPITLHDGRTLHVAPLICYDALDPRLAIAAAHQGADLIVTLSNDSWFAFGNVPRLILLISAFRSIETRRPQVRAANTGISALITNTGELLDTIAVDRRGVLTNVLSPDASQSTLMLAWGDWFGPTALATGVVLLAVSVAQGRRRRVRARA